MNRSELGRQGERLAEEYLRDKGYRILERNYRNRLGEVDIICQDSNTIVFVEVKTRSQTLFGRPEEAVTRAKRAKIERLSQWYLAEKRLEDSDVRLDVVSVRLDSGLESVEHIIGVI